MGLRTQRELGETMGTRGGLVEPRRELWGPGGVEGCARGCGGTGGDLTVHVGLVKDLRLDDLLDDILKRHQPQHLVERVALALVVYLLHDGQM